jgi:hypothetical protein
MEKLLVTWEVCLFLVDPPVECANALSIPATRNRARSELMAAMVAGGNYSLSLHRRCVLGLQVDDDDNINNKGRF